jgi:Protein of unknown function (DUF3592)
VSVDGVFVLVAAAVLLVIGLITVVRASLGWSRQRHAAQVGRAVIGEVTAIDPKYRTYYGLYQLTPVVRYVVDGRQHESRVANQSGALDIGSTLDLRVDPADPDTPFALYGRAITSTLAVGAAFTVFAAVMGVWALHWT